MNRILLSALLASVGFAASVGTTVAQTAPAPAPMGDPAAVQTREDALARADARFDRMDADKDGKLNAEEMRPRGPAPAADGAMPPPPPPPPGAGAPPRDGSRMFAFLDTNGDGAIDRTEYRAQQMRRFDRIDTNKDGKIDQDERQAARDWMESRMGSRAGRGAGAPPPPPPAPDDKPGQ